MKFHFKLNSTIAVLICALSSQVFADDKELTIYNVTSASGPFANFGLQAEKGARLAVETAGEVAGMKVKSVTIDTEGNAGKAARKVQAILSENGPGIFVGTTLSSTALAIGKAVHEAGGVYINGGGADEITGKDCNGSMYRWTTPTYGAVNASLQPVLDQNPDVKRVYTVAPQYVFGEAMLANTKSVLEKRGLKHVGNSYHSLKDKEFSGIIAQAQAAKPDLLVLLNFGSQAEASIKQAINFGLKDRMKILLVWSSGLDTLKSLGNEVSNDIYFGAQYWHVEEASGNQEFLEIAKDRLGETPNYITASYYEMTKMMLDAVSAAGGKDFAKIKAHLSSGTSFNSITGNSSVINANNNQFEKNFYLLKGKASGEMANPDDYAEVIAKNKYYQPYQDTGCVLAKK